MALNTALYYTFSLITLALAFLCGVLCIINGTSYSPVFLGIILATLSPLHMFNITLAEFSEKYIKKLFPVIETTMGSCITYGMMGIACFSQETGWLGLVTGVLLISLSVISSQMLVPEETPANETARLKF